MKQLKCSIISGNKKMHHLKVRFMSDEKIRATLNDYNL